MQKLNITELDAGQRLDKFLAKYLNAAPKSFVYKMLRKKNIELNGKKAEPGALLRSGDEISLWLSDETIAGFRGMEQKSALRKTPKKVSERTLKATPEKAVGRSFEKAVGKASDRTGGRKRRMDRVPIIYEDERLLIADKPAGMLSQKGSASDYSINEYLLDRVRENGSSFGAGANGFRPSVCNRLDRNTSGLITFAKTYQTARLLTGLFAARSLHKYYLAIAAGTISEGFHAEAWIRKDELHNQAEVRSTEFAGAEHIETEYVPLRHFQTPAGEATLLKIRLITGKTHQIRAHLRALGHPILGDPKYGDPVLNRCLFQKTGIRRQLLHAWELQFPEMEGGAVSDLSGKTFRAPIPAEFERVSGDI